MAPVTQIVPTRVPVSLQPKSLVLLNSGAGAAAVTQLEFVPPLPAGSMIMDLRDGAARSLNASGVSFSFPAEILSDLANIVSLGPAKAMRMHVAVTPPYNGELRATLDTQVAAPETYLLPVGHASHAPTAEAAVICLSDEGVRLANAASPLTIVRLAGGVGGIETTQSLAGVGTRRRIELTTPFEVKATDVVEIRDAIGLPVREMENHALVVLTPPRPVVATPP